MYRVGIDIGGTFTDMLLVGEDGRVVIGKTLTTPLIPVWQSRRHYAPCWKAALSTKASGVR
jgi:hypothetical protein